MTNDMSGTIVPKSDQMNADDLIGLESRTIRIVGVDIRQGDQPVSIHYDGGEGKPWKPSKGMRRILVEAWGNDSAAYVGRSVSLVRDPTVRFGKDEVGGIRIAALSNIDKPMRVALTISKGKRVPYEVQPLVGGPPAAKKKAPTPEEKKAAASKRAKEIADEIAACDDVMAVLSKHRDAIDRLRAFDAALAKVVDDAASARQATLAVSDETTEPPAQGTLIADDTDKR